MGEEFGLCLGGSGGGEYGKVGMGEFEEEAEEQLEKDEEKVLEDGQGVPVYDSVDMVTREVSMSQSSLTLTLGEVGELREVGELGSVGEPGKAGEPGSVGEEPLSVALVLLKKLSNSSFAGTELSRGEKRWRVPVSLSLDLCTWTLILSLDTRKLKPARGRDMMDMGGHRETVIWVTFTPGSVLFSWFSFFDCRGLSF